MNHLEHHFNKNPRNESDRGYNYHQSLSQPPHLTLKDTQLTLRSTRETKCITQTQSKLIHSIAFIDHIKKACHQTQ